MLVHDESVQIMKERLQCSNVVMGIRDAKGLEFRDIILVDFFSDLPREAQKPWRELLRDRDTSDIKPGFPQLETHLKLLYTGVTRCSRRLFFAETKPSIAGQAFFRWLTKSRLEVDPDDGPGAEPKEMPPFAVNQDASKTEQAMTPDEIRSSGVDAATNAENEEDGAAKALSWIERALRNFERVGDENLARKARAHQRSLEIRVQLEQNYDGYKLTEEAELEISKAVYACAREGVMPEVYQLIHAILPRLSDLAQKDLNRDLMALLDDFAS
jgi:hypothetical protein